MRKLEKEAGDSDAGAAMQKPRYSPAYSAYVLGILTLTFAFNFADRQLMTILLEPIKAEFGASDTAMGLLTGFAFVLFYATLSVPIARLADRGSRRSVVAASVALWSLMTAACGLAGSFWALAAARMGVAVGEAGGTPASQALLADYYPPRRRSTVLGIYATGSHLGIFLGLFGGAVLAHYWGWRVAFIGLGLPGIALALVVRYTVAEPVRSAAAEAPPPIFATLGDILRSRAFRLLALAAGFTSLSGYGLATWLPSFLVRVHGVPLMHAGLMLGVGSTLGGLAGAVWGGVLCDRMSRRDRAWQLRIPALAVLLSAPVLALLLLWPEHHSWRLGGIAVPVAALFIPINAFLIAMWIGPIYAAAQNLVRPAWRSQALALLLLITNLIGSGGGPLLVGVLSDLFTPFSPMASLRYALLSSLVTVVIGAVLFWRAGAFYRLESNPDA